MQFVCREKIKLFLKKVNSSGFRGKLAFEPRSEKTGLRGFRPGPTQTGLHSHKRLLEAGNFVFRK